MAYKRKRGHTKDNKTPPWPPTVPGPSRQPSVRRLPVNVGSHALAICSKIETGSMSLAIAMVSDIAVPTVTTKETAQFGLGESPLPVEEVSPFGWVCMPSD